MLEIAVRPRGRSPELPRPRNGDGMRTYVPRPMQSAFRSLRLSSQLLEVTGELGYEQPTPIHARGIPPFLEERDLIGQSKTGSSKTAAFTLPILERLELEPRRLRALVLCPTRERESAWRSMSSVGSTRRTCSSAWRHCSSRGERRSSFVPTTAQSSPRGRTGVAGTGQRPDVVHRTGKPLGRTATSNRSTEKATRRAARPGDLL